MKSRERTLRITLSSALLIATLACGVYVYRYESNKQEEKNVEQAKDEGSNQEILSEEPQVDVDENDDTEVSEYDEPVQDVNTGNVEAEQQEPVASETATTTTTTTTTEGVLPALDFNEGTLLTLPLSGEYVIPYNMDNTVYFSTLDQYRCNPAVVIAAEVGTPVAVVANSQVLSIEEDAITGTTVTMDMGNGYQAVYGQLKDVSVEAGETVSAGTVIGSVQTPTKYFVKEGSNLYFAMTKEGTPLDPSLYLPPEVE